MTPDRARALHELAAGINQGLKAARGENDDRIRQRLAEELCKHQGLVGPREPDQPAVWFRWCICGWDGGPLAAGEASNDTRSYRAHVAAMLEQTVRDLIAEELDALAWQADLGWGSSFARVLVARAAAVRSRTEETT